MMFVFLVTKIKITNTYPELLVIDMEDDVPYEYEE